MNCRDWEERLALYAGGDLPAAQAAEVESHLAECAGCQLFASGLKEGLVLLQEAHQEAPAAAAFTAVRSRVLVQLERERRSFWRRAWVYGFAMVAAALLVAVAVRPARWMTPQPPEVAVIHPPVPPALPGPTHQQPRRARHRSRPNVAPSEPVLVRLVTDNPDLVIYWISERRGDY